LTHLIERKQNVTTIEESYTKPEHKSTERARRKRKSRRRNWLIFAAVMVLAAAGFSYYQFIYLPTQGTTEVVEAEMQTATIRQGDIVLYASGAGELIAASDVTVTFPVTAEITTVNYVVGDEVEAGDVLMTLETTDLVKAYTEAARAFNEIISPASIARAKQQAAEYEVEVNSNESTLKWLISGETYYWEEKLEEAQAALEAAQAESNQEAIAEAEALIASAESGLNRANYNYETNYVPNNFTYEDCTGSGRDQTCTEYVSGPSEANIRDARYTLELNEALLAEAQDYLTLITTGDVSDEATGADITNYYNLLDAMQSAQENLEAADLAAPTSGVITELSGKVGDLSTSSVQATITNVDTLYVEIFLDASDWDKIDLGYDVEIIFDALPDRTFTGTVIQVDPFLTTSGGATVIGGLVALETEDQALIEKMPLGSSAAVEVIGGRAEGVLLVPVEALREVSEGQYAVFVLEDGEPTLTMIEIGLEDIYYAEVISGLEPGEVVTTGIVETE
jgi:multidrug efflux pump subunit AcrA (membrane-fusion protein)